MCIRDRGAAIATVLGQIVAACFAIFMNLKFNRDVHIRPWEIRWNGAIAREIYRAVSYTHLDVYKRQT